MSDLFSVRSSRGDYQVQFGPAAEALREEDPSSFFLIDEKLGSIQGERLAGVLGRGRVYLVSPSESFKTGAQSLRIIEQIVESGFRRSETLVAIGGGVTQDLTAFIASILFRGVEWRYYPTTLLAQADSCIGSKSSINLAGYKNLLGTFNPPRFIVVDTGFLDTLPQREIRSGIGEILHYFLIDGIDGAERLMGDYERLLREPQLLARHIRASLDIKRRVVEIDEFDRNVRNIFNYGHTFGHALESASDYEVSHGEAVTLGMDLANELSRRIGWLGDSDFTRMRAVLTPNMPKYVLSENALPRYFSALSRDKKNRADSLGCILTRGPGRMETVQLPMDDSLRNMIARYFTDRQSSHSDYEAAAER